MFKKVIIENFRGIKNIVVEPLNKINIFVGDNMVGKTTILDALFIAVNPNDLILPFRTNNFRNIDSLPDISQFFALFNYLKTEKDILIYLKDNNNERKIRISAKFQNSNLNGLNNQEKDVKFIDYPDKSEIVSTTENIKNIIGLESNFSIKGINYKSDIEILSNGIVRTNGDKKYRQDLKGRYINTITSNTKNLADIFSIVIEEKRKEEVLKFLRIFKKSIVDINIINIMQNNTIVINDNDFKKAIDINYYGTGLTKALYIYLSFLISDDDIVLIDEIENGLFFSRQKIIWKTISEIIKKGDKQYFITTHSADMIRNLFEIASENNFLNSVSLFRIENLSGKNQSIYYSKDQFENAMELDLETRG